MTTVILTILWVAIFILTNFYNCDFWQWRLLYWRFFTMPIFTITTFIAYALSWSWALLVYGRKDLSDWRVCKSGRGVLFHAYCKVVDLFWDHYWLKPRTRVSILVKYWRVKTGRGGAFGLILQSGRYIFLVSKILSFAYVLLVFWSFWEFTLGILGSPLWDS